MSLDVQRVRLHRMLLAGLASGLYLLLCWVVWLVGTMQLSLWGMLGVSLVIAGSSLTFIGVILSGVNLRFKDPSLTIPAILWSSVLVFFSSAFAGELRGQLMNMVLLVLMFGVFRLRLKDFLRIGLFCMVCYLAQWSVLSYLGWAQSLREELLQALMFFGLFGGVVMLAVEMSGLRLRLQSGNQELRGAMERIQEMAVTDELTGLYNRRFAKDLLAQQKQMADRGGSSFVVALIDIDFFKSINDNFGHAVGDSVLKHIAKLLREAVRDIDFVARVGGEEFLLVLVGLDVPKACAVIERFQQRLSREHWPKLDGRHLTISAGLAGYRVGEHYEQSLQRADQALYKAKEQGRNQWCCED